MYNSNFIALAKEASFAYEILSSGVTLLRKANYAKKGIYFQSFINLTVGLERLGKLCVMLDYYIENSGSFPNEKYLKKRIGHDIEKLFNKANEIRKKRDYVFKFGNYFNDDLHKNILNILKDFAMKDRYENFDILLNPSENKNLIERWFNQVDMPLFIKHVSKMKKLKIEYNAYMIHQMSSKFTVVDFIAEDNSNIDEVFEASLRTGIYESVGVYRQLYVSHIIRFMTELLWELQSDAQKLGKEDIPFFSDNFGCFYNDDSYLRTRKTYEV